MKRALIKWAIACVALIVLFAIFGDIGILFWVGLLYVLLTFN